jgi:hypothetical protein
MRAGLFGRDEELTRRSVVRAVGMSLIAVSLLTLMAPAPPDVSGSTAGAIGHLGLGVDGTTARSVSFDKTNKGVCLWTFRGVNAALKESGASWYLTWSTAHEGVVTPRGVQFVPMIRSASNVTPASLTQVEHSGRSLLTFNEPDLKSQANMTVAQALSLWPKLMATNLELASPAVATGAATPGGWLDRFMNGVKQRHYRVNFIAVHWYGADFRTGPAVAELKSYLESVHRLYGRPVWLTEFALIGFSSAGSVYPSSAEQAAFVTASVRMLDDLSFVQRYAWFALPAPSSGTSSGLFAPGPRATAAGLAFARS